MLDRLGQAARTRKARSGLGPDVLRLAVAERSSVHYSWRVRFEKVWITQCRATRAIKRRFGAKSALDYLIGEKLPAFADAANDHPEFAGELPRFLSAIYCVFNQYEIAGYVATRKPRARKALQRLLLTGRA